MFGEYLRSAVASIKNNKGRSFLTMLGIIIGITAVLTVLIIGDGMKDAVNSEMDSIGAASLTISLDVTKTDKCFTRANINEIDEALDNIYGVTPTINMGGNATAGNRTFDAFFRGGSEAVEKSGGTTMVYGRYFTKSDVDEAKRVCVISQIAAKSLFGYEEVVGKTISLDMWGSQADFTIVGVRKDTSQDTGFASYGDDPTLMGDFPYTAACDAFHINVDNYFTGVSIYMDSDYKDDVIKSARSVIENVMDLRGEGAVKISTSMGFDQTANSIMDIITSVVAIIAGISLLVGGIGVMNIMTVSVTERTREIGIRKSLGARTASILTQFLAEAAILTFVGGVIGIICGLSLSYLLCSLVGFGFVVNPLLVLGVVAISTAIGLFFGIYPAKRAAALDPIEALRTE